MRLFERSTAKGGPDPKTFSCYGFFLPEFERTRLGASSMAREWRDNTVSRVVL